MANKSGIRIKPSHRGLLTKKMGKKVHSISALQKKKAAAKESGDTKTEKQVTFALNAKKWNHSGPRKSKGPSSRKK